MNRTTIVIIALIVESSMAAAQSDRESASQIPAWCSVETHYAEVVTLARVCAHEAGPGAVEDCAAIRAVHVGLATNRRTSVLEQVWAYSPRALGARTRRAWFATLDASCRAAPETWPEELSWSAFESEWADHIVSVESIVAGVTASRCVASVHDWGCRDCGDRERAARLGLVPVDCGDTKNDFYARPSMRRSERSRRRR